MNEIANHLSAVTVTIILLSGFLLINSLIVLLLVKGGRWIALRIQRELKRPAEVILRPSKLLRRVDKHFAVAPKIAEVKKAKGAGK